MAVVGIDLGTTNTVIAAVRDGRATSLKDKNGRALLPSVVSFGLKGSTKVGYPAKDRRTIDPENTVFSIKRLIGRTFESEPVQKSIPRYPFRIKEGPGKSTLVNCQGQDHTLPEISALVLQEAVAIAEQRLDERVSDAVITVPANFNDLQRAATKIAGRTAGLEVLRIINEPTAAALAYGFGKSGRERIVVYDFGGGTFDVTLLDLNENVFEVLATAGDTFLGGDDVDRAIMDCMAEALLKEQKIDASKDILVREQLRAAAENLKIELSTRSLAKIRIEDLEFDFSMRRAEFEGLVEPLLTRTLSVCQEALDIAGVSIKDVEQVLLVGGSTRIPLVRRRVSSFFAKMPQSRINPDEVVAIGAAIQASTLELKQGISHLPGAPRPRATATLNPSDAAGTAQGTTKTGLAGLRQTLQGPAASADPAAVRPGSVLSGLKKTLGVSVAPDTNTAESPSAAESPSVAASSATAASPPARRKTDTWSGVGEPNLGSGVLAETKGSTNLGLGQAPGSPPTQLGAAPPRSVVRAPGGISPPQEPTAQALPAAESAPELSLSAQMNALSNASSDAPPAEGDGSVTFDLAELEAEAPSPEPQAEEFSEQEFEDETTEVFDRKDLGKKRNPVARPLSVTTRGGTLDPALLDAELPVAVTRAPVVEELSDSALFTLPDEDEQPTINLQSAGAAHEKSLPQAARDESDMMSLRALEVEDEEELDLPSPAVRSFPESNFEQDRESDLPLPVVHAPAADLPTYQTSHRVEDAALRAGLPQTKATAAPKTSPNLSRTAIGVAPDANLPAPLKPPAPLKAPAAFQRPSSAQTASGTTQPATAKAGGGTPSSDTPTREFDYGVEPAQPPVGLSTQPGGTFDLEFPAREMMDSIAELDELSAAPIDAHTSFVPPATADAGHHESTYPAVALGTHRPLLLDVTPLSLGVEVVGGYVDKLIERNSPVPCATTRTFATASDNQAVVVVRVSQGEDRRFTNNTVLGEVRLQGLPPGPRGSVKIDVSFSLDESGMLQVSARDPRTGQAANARLTLAGVGS